MTKRFTYDPLAVLRRANSERAASRQPSRLSQLSRALIERLNSNASASRDSALNSSPHPSPKLDGSSSASHERFTFDPWSALSRHQPTETTTDFYPSGSDPAPYGPLNSASPQHLDPELLDAFEERAAIMEYEAGLSRSEAEARAFDDVCETAGNSSDLKRQTKA